MMDDPGRTVSLALQCVNPLRIYVLPDKAEDSIIRGGLSLGTFGRPEINWMANIEDAYITYSLSSVSIAKVSDGSGYRSGSFHFLYYSHYTNIFSAFSGAAASVDICVYLWLKCFCLSEWGCTCLSSCHLVS